MPLPLRTLLFLRELPSGDVAAAPVADATLVSHGGEASALAEQRLFLGEHLAAAPPETVARFALPDGVTLHEVDVLLPRDDLPRRVRVETPLRIPCVVVPSAKDAWIFVPALDHVFYAPAGEDLHEAIRTEVQRIAAARELSPWDYLRLFPARAHSLVSLDLAVDRGVAVTGGRVGGAKGQLLDREKKRWAAEVLASVATRIDTGSAPRIVGRDAEARELATLLEAKDKSAVLVVGAHLVGKTALLMAAFATASRAVFATSSSQLIAGMAGLGQWQERVRRVMEAAETLDAILYFDNLGDLLGDRPDASVDVAGAMRPWLEEGRVRIAAELRTELLDPAEQRSFGFLSYFTRVRLDALDEKQTLDALRVRADEDRRRDPDGPRLSPDAMLPLVSLAARYLPYQAFPGKAMRLYDELRTVHEKLAASPQASPSITKTHVLDLFGARTGMPAFLLRDDHALRVEDVIERLAARVVGQDEAVRLVAETVCVVKAGLQPAGKPLATFLFAGPTGVGKTELARALAALLFGAGDRLTRFDMSEFTDESAAERLIRGTDRAEGLLTRKVREQPFAVVLLDEIEKAHPAVFDLLLQVCGEGRLTDARGRTAWFQNTIVIMTSNLGSKGKRPMAGFGETMDGDDEARAARAHALAEVLRTFRPELVNRLDRIVLFSPLPQAAIRKVTDLAIAKVAARRGIVEARAKLDASEGAARALTSRGYSATFGARALRRAIEDDLVAPLSRLLSKLGDAARGSTIRVRATGEGARDASAIACVETSFLRIEVHRSTAGARARDEHVLDVVTRARREIDAHMSLERIEQLGDHIAFVVTQLDYGKKRPGDRRAATELAELQADHHRTSAVWNRLAEAQGEMHALEELALGAVLDAQPLDGFATDAREIASRFRRALALALVAEEPHRDHVTLLLEDLSAGRALAPWLAPLLVELPRRGWSAVLHADGGARAPDDDWPPARRWGPPREPDAFLELLGDGDRAPRNVLVRVSGAYAGVLLALEAGLHAMHHTDDEAERALLFVRRIAMRSTFVDREWSAKSLVPDGPAMHPVLVRQKPVRDHDFATGKVGIAASARFVALDPRSADYFRRLEDIALEHLLHAEEASLDRDDLFLGPLDTAL